MFLKSRALFQLKICKSEYHFVTSNHLVRVVLGSKVDSDRWGGGGHNVQQYWEKVTQTDRLMRNQIGLIGSGGSKKKKRVKKLKYFQTIFLPNVGLIFSGTNRDK